MNIYAMEPCARGTHTAFTVQEGGCCTVEIDASRPGDIAALRIRLHFRGFVQARVNDPADTPSEFRRALRERNDGQWLENFGQRYLEEHGPKLWVVAVKGVKHFVVQGHDMSIGLLARVVDAEPV